MERMAGNSEGTKRFRDYEVPVLDLNSLGGLGLETRIFRRVFGQATDFGQELELPRFGEILPVLQGMATTSGLPTNRPGRQVRDHHPLLQSGVILNAVKDLRLPLRVSKWRYFRVVDDSSGTRKKGSVELLTKSRVRGWSAPTASVLPRVEECGVISVADEHAAEQPQR